MNKPTIATVEDGFAWIAANGCGLNALMQHEDRSWRCSIRVKQGERGMAGQHIWRDGPTAVESVRLACEDMWALSTAPKNPTRPARGARVEVEDEPVAPVPRRAAAPRRVAPSDFDDVV
jgi:hypothetical protein